MGDSARIKAAKTPASGPNITRASPQIAASATTLVSMAGRRSHHSDWLTCIMMRRITM